MFLPFWATAKILFQTKLVCILKHKERDTIVLNFLFSICYNLIIIDNPKQIIAHFFLMCLILNKDFIFSENTCVYVLKPSDNKNRAMSVMRRKVSEVSSKQQNTVLIKDTINSVWNEMGLLGQQQSPLLKN